MRPTASPSGGQDFRPSYLKIRDFLAGLPQRPVVSAFTATATAEVQEDILTQLGLQDPVKVVTGFDRPNLFFDVRRPEKKQPLLLSLVEARREKSGIVYCATRAGVERSVTSSASRASPPPGTTRACQRRSGGRTRTTFSTTARR